MNKKEITKLLEMVNDDNIESLKSYLNDELTKIKLKETYGNNYVSATKKIKKYLDKAGKTRPILNYYDIQNGKQCFTDTFFALRYFFLRRLFHVKHDFLSEISESVSHETFSRQNRLTQA